MKKTTGTVIFAKMEKTVAVEIKIMTIHPLYKKRIWKKRKYLVHNDMGAKVGDKVVFTECRPISKKIHWTITDVIATKDNVIATKDNVIATKDNVIASVAKQSHPKRTVKRSVKK